MGHHVILGPQAIAWVAWPSRCLCPGVNVELGAPGRRSCMPVRYSTTVPRVYQTHDYKESVYLVNYNKCNQFHTIIVAAI